MDGIDIFVSKGNLSESTDTTIFNLPAVKTCPRHVHCASSCYARKAERVYPGVLPRREKNLVATKNPKFVEAMVAILRKGSSRKVRIHESGDFYSDAYIEKWKKIISSNPSTRFKAFTKVKKAYDVLSKLPNMAIHLSVLPGGEINYGDDGHIRSMVDKYAAFECPKKGARDIHNKRVHSCSTVSCSKCWDKKEKYIVFAKH